MTDTPISHSADSDLLNSARNGDSAGIQTALTAGANINVRDDMGDTALIIAIQNGTLPAVDMLLNAAPDVTAKGGADMTALHWAVREGCTDVVARLLATNAFTEKRLLNDVMSVATMTSDRSEVVIGLVQKRLLELTKPTGPVGDLRIQLITSAEQGDPQGVSAALAAGADVNARDDRDMTALNWAALRGHSTVVDLLLQNKARTDMRNSVGRDPLVQASAEGHVDATRALIQAGADVNSTFGGGKTALMCAAHQGHLPVAELLLEAGADPSMRTNEDENGTSTTARKLADMRRHSAIVDLIDRYLKQ